MTDNGWLEIARLLLQQADDEFHGMADRTTVLARAMQMTYEENWTYIGRTADEVQAALRERIAEEK